MSIATHRFGMHCLLVILGACAWLSSGSSPAGAAVSVDYGRLDGLAAIIPEANVEQALVRDAELYVVSGQRLSTYDVSDPARPRRTSRLQLDATFGRGLSTQRNLMWLSNANSTQLVGIDDPRHPVLLGKVPGTGTAAVCGNFLVCSRSTSLAVYDITDPHEPALVREVDPAGTLLGGWDDRLLVYRQGTWIGYPRPTLVAMPIMADGTLGEESVLYDQPWTVCGFRLNGIVLQSYPDLARLVLSVWYASCDDESQGTVWPKVPLAGSHPDTRTRADLFPVWTPNFLGCSTIVPAYFRASNSLHDFRLATNRECGEPYLKATPLPGAAADGGSFALHAGGARWVCGSREQLFVGTATEIRVYDFQGRGFPDSTRVLYRDTSATMRQRSGEASAPAWLEYSVFERCDTDMDGTHCRHRFENAWVGPAIGPDATGSRRESIGMTGVSDIVAIDDTTFAWADAGYWPHVRIGPLDGSLRSTFPDLPAVDLLAVGTSVHALHEDRLWTIDATDRRQPRLAGKMALPFYAGSLHRWARGIAAAGSAGDLALMTPGGTTPWQIVSTIVTPAPVTAVASTDSSLTYACDRSVTFCDLEPDGSVVTTGHVEAMAPVLGFAVGGPILYAACGEAGLLVYERTDAYTARYVGGWPLDRVWDVVRQDDHLLVATSHGLVTLPLQEGDTTQPWTPALPAAAQIVSAVPNPFNPQVTLSYRLPREQFVAVGIHDLRGRLVRRLAGGVHGPGSGDLVWDGRDDAGRQVAAGAYIARLDAGDQVSNLKIMLVR